MKFRTTRTATNATTTAKSVFGAATNNPGVPVISDKKARQRPLSDASSTPRQRARNGDGEEHGHPPAGEPDHRPRHQLIFPSADSMLAASQNLAHVHQLRIARASRVNHRSRSQYRGGATA